MRPVIATHHGPELDPQRRFDVAVVIPTVLRPTLARALRSVYDQAFGGTVQVLIGLDGAGGERGVLDAAVAARPGRCAVSVLDLGYSTAAAKGGTHPAQAGALRTILSYAANSRYVAYLDDDNWWHPDHLANLLDAIRGFHWCFSLRWYVDPETQEPLCVDRWESVGPGRGIFKDKFGGFVDPNCLMIDKIACESVLRWWAIPLPGMPGGRASDRNVFRHLKDHFSVAWSGRPSAYYVLDPNDGNHPLRQKLIAEARGAASA